MTKLAFSSRISIWALWLALLLTGPIAAAWIVAAISMVGAGTSPPAEWTVASVSWVLLALGVLVWSYRQTSANRVLAARRWAVQATGLLLSFIAGAAWTLQYFYSGNHHG